MRGEILALYLAYQDPRVPKRAKILTVLILGYLLSPIDLIPDFIPVIGFVDDLVIVPAGIAVVRRMIPKEVLEECRQRAAVETVSGRMKWVGTVLVVTVWALVVYFLLKLLRIL